MKVSFAALLVALCAGCPATGDEVHPPPDQFYYPTSIATSTDPEQDFLFVVNANSDLRYDSGTVQVISLTGVDDRIDDWLETADVPGDIDCSIDLLVPYTMVCDERDFIRGGSAVRIGNFATDVKVQRFAGEGRQRLFVAVRGDPSLTWIDFEDGTLSCNESGDSECDDRHRLVQLRNDEDFLSLPSEPFGLYVDADEHYVVMTHFLNGAVTMADAPAEGDPILSDAIGNLFAGDPNTGARSSVGVAGRPTGPSAEDGQNESHRIYVTSPIEARVQTLVAVRRQDGLPTMVSAEYFFLSRGVNTSSNSRGIVFSDDGNRSYIVNRAPPMLHIIDTSLDEVGVPRNQFLGGVELCPEASNLTVSRIDDRERVFVSCFRNGQVWSIDPVGQVVDQIIEVGNGPQSLAVSNRRQKLYVTNNLENTIAVVNLTPEAETENRVVLRIGRPQSAGEAP